MRLYFAGVGDPSVAQHVRDFQCGVRNRLASFYDIVSVAGEHSPRGQQIIAFWVNERCEALKLYVAGNGKAPDSDLKDYETGARNRLLSYAFLSDWAKEAFAFWVNHAPQQASVFLDSGAFSAKTRGTAIDLPQYCAYVEAHKPALAAYAVLDVIGDAEASQRNLDYMRGRGLDPVPVYHVAAEPLAVLERILADHTGYVALGGMASESATKDAVMQALDGCWRVIERHWPVRVHGLGVMAQWALERYPWYSCDGSSAIVAAGMGRVSRFNRGTPPERGRGADGRFVSNGWTDDARDNGDGVVMDGVGRTEGKSLSAHSGRRRRNIEAQLALERYVTDLWATRGVRWDS